MSIDYYVVPSDMVSILEKLQPSDFLNPEQRYIYAFSPNGAKALVRSDWNEQSLQLLSIHGRKIGSLLPNGNAEQAIYDYLESDEWLLN